MFRGEEGTAGRRGAHCQEPDQALPYFDFIESLQAGDAGRHGVLELLGIAKPWRRKPSHSLSDEQMERLWGFPKASGLL